MSVLEPLNEKVVVAAVRLSILKLSFSATLIPLLLVLIFGYIYMLYVLW